VSQFVNQAVDDASVLRRLACEPTKLNGEEQSFVNALSRRDKAVQVRFARFFFFFTLLASEECLSSEGFSLSIHGNRGSY
jgi:hypothetical protein